MSSLQAFPRADGSVGIRNIVLVVSTVTCANTVVNHIAWKTGAVPLTHERGCVEGEQSFRRTMLALTTFAKHPNVSGVLIVGLGCEQIRTLDLHRRRQARARHPHSGGGRLRRSRGQRL